jgi:DNA-binding response OmpR family regulator
MWECNSLVDPRKRRLREKLGAAAKQLDTIRGVGCRFVAND